MAIKLDEVNKILYAYDIKNDIVDENSKEILTQTNNLIYGKIKSHFNINPKDFGLHINNFTNEEDEYLESLEIADIIKERTINKNESTKMITENEINYLKNKLKSSKK
ncbi:hypothetical protein [Aliarcobacter butzleri]|uniref:hypothetical protein n=1 Tax=Aliarcobacter butzleri TaxID=28197 RepID=UPI00125F09F6|nr:hypothetical protein [Aliarcobacter butzleri]MCT7549914.1 hypothetical protein [Aliarcobacter butzleri]MCT7559538.1 hypothetical protein [Aliarcobacter butzleri]MCT7591399.1 hypothetical protein [Aliarcobacter butzleri]MCT7595632.1 hypothetical protein [Aliarcobacter butzleri]MCT7600168.1 hypothetical protein [Aliarcobacter butzleri]